MSGNDDMAGRGPDRPEAAAELTAFMEAGAFWRLVPEWVPRTGFAEPTPDLLRDVAAGLRQRSQA
ncbi:hypothetical protein AN217_10460 [Streptomyces qinglanensis]|uniref:Uncharacterized protein n=1 Tax=Streptomyces qinglanensis TaxID=943816 RepID=A0A1E7K2M3_9ACTN|nr:hypothetical protein [Streptomyces qinglanensis]MBE9499165.1 hypothetical protein [Streptomyces sp. GKU 257-1]OEU98178.1 hypothetical protein AN217_10460 [Streptomyces qinglanensis]OEV26040.1 hypothetical protein AN220_10605 [Streptomyces nanshensis]